MVKLYIYLKNLILNQFQKDSKTLFEGLEIANRHELCTEWMNQWPTVFVSFRQVDGLNFNSAYDMLTLVISELYKKHLYLMDSDKLDSFDKEIVKQLIQGTASAKDTKGSLMLLTRLMYQQYGKPVILLIDEYDVPVAKASIFTGTNNFISDTITDSMLNEYFGFVQSEADQILKDADVLDKAESVREWYDGYHFGDFDVYCPWDVMNYLHSSENNLWSMLYLTGYLTKAREEDYNGKLAN